MIIRRQTVIYIVYFITAEGSQLLTPALKDPEIRDFMKVSSERRFMGAASSSVAGVYNWAGEGGGGRRMFIHSCSHIQKELIVQNTIFEYSPANYRHWLRHWQHLCSSKIRQNVFDRL